MSNIQNVYDYIQKHGEVTTGQMIRDLKYHKRSLYRYLNQLVDDGKITREGKPPNVTYKLVGANKPKPITQEVSVLPAKASKPVIAKPTNEKPLSPTSTASSPSETTSSKHMLLWVAIIVVIFLIMLSWVRGQNSNQSSNSDSAELTDTVSGTLFFDTQRSQYYLYTDNNQIVLLKISDSPSLRRLIGRELTFPAAFQTDTQTLTVPDSESVEMYQQNDEVDSSAPEPQL